jgi:hypothetical protein
LRRGREPTAKRASIALAAVFLVGFIAPCPADVPNDQRLEVRHLIGFLRDSACAMIRNGKSYAGEAGARHVQRKYDHFREDIRSTEEFIEYAATRSTMSGQPYRVQCPGHQPVPSRDWLLEELQAFRRRQQP